MKNISALFIICFLCMPLLIHAQEDSPEEEPDVVEEHFAPREFRIADGAFEIGLNAELGFANNALATNTIFQKTLVLDLDELSDGLKIDLGVGVTPLFFNYDSTRGWGVGLSIGAEAAGIVDISGDMISLRQTENSKSALSGAIFASLDIDAFYMIQKFKVKFSPALYSTLAYIKSDVAYGNKNVGQETLLYIDFGLDIFTAFSPLALGVDFSAGVEYPLSQEIGLRDKYPILDFDVGIDFVNIPIVPSIMKSYTKRDIRLGSKEPLSLMDLMSTFDIDDDSPVDGMGNEKVFRPFKMLVWANWRLFPGDLPLTIIPAIGFSINPFYIELGAVEAGVKANLLLANHFLFTAGIGYYDRLWKNSLGIDFIFKVVEFNIGADLRSQDFVKSWSAGFGLNFGVKFKWGAVPRQPSPANYSGNSLLR